MDVQRADILVLVASRLNLAPRPLSFYPGLTPRCMQVTTLCHLLTLSVWYV